MQADQPLWPRQPSRDGGNRQGGGVGRKDGIWRQQRLQRRKNRLLHGQPLHHRLDHQIGRGKVFHPLDHPQAAKDRRPLDHGHSTLGDTQIQRPPKPVGGTDPRIGYGIGGQHILSPLGKDLCNAKAHRPKADDPDGHLP